MISECDQGVCVVELYVLLLLTSEDTYIYSHVSSEVNNISKKQSVHTTLIDCHVTYDTAGSVDHHITVLGLALHSVICYTTCFTVYTHI